MMLQSRLLVSVALLALSVSAAVKEAASAPSTDHDTLTDVEEAVREYLEQKAQQASISSPNEVGEVPATASPSPSSTPGQTFQTQRCSFTEESSTLLNIECQAIHLRFIGLGDWGETSESAGVLAVRDGVWAAAATGNYEYIMAVGDNFYGSGVENMTDSQWYTTWFDRFGIGTTLTLPWVALLGNHDWYGNTTAQIEYGLSSEAGSQFWFMPSKYFSVENTMASGETVKFVVADTMTLNSTEDFAWLEQEFADNSSTVTLAVGHHHIYSQGGRGDNTETAMVRLRAMIESNGHVKAYIGGHEHDMQYLRANGTDYFMHGGGGRNILPEEQPGTAAEIIFYKKEYGFALYDVDVANRIMDVTYHVFSTDGEPVDELTFRRYY